MSIAIRITVLIAALVTAAPSPRAQMPDAVAQDIISLERKALDGWINADSSAYEALLAADVTVFDPRLQQRLNGRDAVLGFLRTIRPATAIPGYTMIDPRVQPLDSSSAVLTFIFESHDASNAPTSRWNFTEVYRRNGTRWEIAHTHAAFVGGSPPGIAR